MLAEIAAANAEDWRPRWYYVMRNKTSGLQYVGQTYNLHSRSYCGSGQYWVAHCKKHGGYGRKNIEIVKQFWAKSKSDAQGWLDNFEQVNSNYFERSNTAWANRARETTSDSAFCGVTKESRVNYARAGGFAMTKAHPNIIKSQGEIQGKINRESGHMQSIQKIGCSLGGKAAGSKNGKAAVASGQLAKAAVLGGRAVSVARHAQKDEVTGKSIFAVKSGKASGATKGLMAEFCKLNGIKKPGVNYCNMDRQAFKAWRARHAG
jgi:hypothetical protein